MECGSMLHVMLIDLSNFNTVMHRPSRMPRYALHFDCVCVYSSICLASVPNYTVSQKCCHL